ncbi:MAG: lipo-like protein, partial [Candidatus Tectomicrobia bacterium]
MGGRLAQYLQRSSRKYQPFSVSDPDTLCRILEPGDVLLVEGNQKISAAIKYLTQSTWSHSAFYVGNAMPSSDVNSEPCGLIEALVTEGIVAVPLS